MRSTLAPLFAIVALLTGCGPSEAEIKAEKEKEAYAKLKEHQNEYARKLRESSARWVAEPEKQEKLKPV